MKKALFITVCLLSVFTGCTQKEEMIVFTGQIQSLDESSMVVHITTDERFDGASVDIGQVEGIQELSVGDQVEITITPEIRESYPVQVTAVKVEEIAVTYQKITAEQAKKMVDEGTYGTILDVRTEEEYNEGHIENAMLLPVANIADEVEAALPNKEQVILVYCRSGNRSEQAAKELIDMGYTSIYDFGGITDWPYDVVKE